MSNKLREIEEFVDYVQERLEVECCHSLDADSSNLLLLVEDEGERYVVKRYHSAAAFKLESYVLGQMSGLKVPRLIYSESQEKDSWNWLVYKYIEGIPLYAMAKSINPTLLCKVFAEIGSFLSVFHHRFAIKDDKLFEDFKQDTMLRIDLNYACATQRGENPLLQKAVSFLKQNFCLLDREDKYGLIIKDFTDKHILVAKSQGSWGLTGVIDFEMVRYAHRYSDFSCLYMSWLLKNGDLEQAFWDGYGITLSEQEKVTTAFFILKDALELCGILSGVHIENRLEGEEIIRETLYWINQF